jgi:hypothetical protein
MYQIQTRKPATDERHANDWTSDGIGEGNRFATEAEAEAAIESLRALGRDWAESEYRVRELA